MTKKHMTNVILGYCIALLVGAFGFMMWNESGNLYDTSAKANLSDNSENNEFPGVMGNTENPTPAQSFDIKEEEVLPPVDIPTEETVAIEGPEDWKRFVYELGTTWNNVSDKPAILIKKPASKDENGVSAKLLENEKNIELVLENCVYTEFYYSSIERRVNGRYYNSRPVQENTATDIDDSMQENTNVSANSFDESEDPLRKLGSMLIKQKDGSYTITVKLLLDKEYEYQMIETQSFVAIILTKGMK